MLARVKGRIRHMVLSRVSPLAVPVLLEIGRESVRSGQSDEDLLAEAETLVAEATGEAEPPPFRPRVPAVHRANFARKARQRQAAACLVNLQPQGIHRNSGFYTREIRQSHLH